MYKVFVNDTPIILSTKKDLGGEYKTYSIKTVRLKRLIRKINKGETNPKALNLFRNNDCCSFFFKGVPSAACKVSELAFIVRD